ncbi:hypothetical protein [Chitinophaga niabensis]|uniref:Uncharacterized protein n=1 Tax=Chitinophaga niabensis TaxID=536979 RepID=A0A1N6H1J3_9BACT|nr:hypothetical protein [Chitinophaga niabensis]SIO13650.1 hypothetical protein SAMN04488055_3119 [Chitinophaga niabensis]
MSLSIKEKEQCLKTASSFHALFKEPGELVQALWPLIVAAAESEYFEDMDASEKQKIFIAFGETLRFTEAACQLLQDDIITYRQLFKQ